MKKYYNKSLIYQYMYLGKWYLLGSGLILGIIIFGQFLTSIENVKNEIAIIGGNSFNYSYKSIFMVFVMLLICFQLVISGNNKRSNLTLLRSCPFSSEEIKYNEIVCLIIALMVYVGIYMYFSIITYINYKDLLSIVPNYWNEIIYNLIRFFLVGILFILYESFMSMLFSNGIASGIFTLLTPFILIIDIQLFYSSFNVFTHRWIGLSRIGNLFGTVFDFMFSDRNVYITNYVSMKWIFDLLIGCVSVIVVSIGLFLLIRTLIKRELINNMNKIFTFNKAQFIILFMVVFSILMNIFSLVAGSIEFNFSSNFILSTVIYIFSISVVLVSTYLLSLVIHKKLNKII